jgi:diguanylate cyclase (GGDEF)-like protein
VIALRAALRWFHDPAIVRHPRYRAWERSHILLAVRAGSLTVAAVQLLDAVLVGPVASELLLVNLPTAAVALVLVRVLHQRGNARRNPVVAAFLLGLLGLVAALLPMVLVPAVAPMMAAYIPIMIVASALFVPWTIRWHLPWLVAAIAGVAVFASSPLAGTLTAAGRQELVSITVSAAVVSFAGHVILHRERQRSFSQRMQLRGLSETARRHRREMAALAAQLETVARRDPLTGISNRLRLDEDVAALRGSGRPDAATTAAILLDIDHFKAFNDRHGHLAGDAILREVARTIAVNLRPTDRVYRFGGEEFLILLEATDEVTAELVAERVRAAVEEQQIAHPDNEPWGLLTVSAGVAAIDLAGPAADAWIHEADERLYAAKRAGRNRVSGADRPLRRPVARAPRPTAQPAA